MTSPNDIRSVTVACVSTQASWDGPELEIRPGDVVSIPPGVKHWHGAAPTTAMSHIAVQEQQDGTAVTWLEAVATAA